uniref:Uncharacterized protein n=1 Tax=Romanomermis culicivorax TaxID=13658 RepID=A0A915J687_ROMCU
MVVSIGKAGRTLVDQQKKKKAGKAKAKAGQIGISTVGMIVRAPAPATQLPLTMQAAQQLTQQQMHPPKHLLPKTSQPFCTVVQARLIPGLWDDADSMEAMCHANVTTEAQEPAASSVPVEQEMSTTASVPVKLMPSTMVTASPTSTRQLPVLQVPKSWSSIFNRQLADPS